MPSPFAKSFLIALTGALLFFASNVFAFESDTPVTPDASPEAQRLLAFFANIYGHKIISGQEDGWRHSTNGMSAELNYITNTTGKLPALLAADLAGAMDKSSRRGGSHQLVQRALDWSNRNGLVEFCCHWRAPMNEPEFYTKQTSFDITRAVTEGTPEYEATERDLDAMAAELEILCDAHVPVLWRPLHESNGRWFWWGNGGPEPFKKLWCMMFENFTVKHHLNNLIWIFSPGAEVDLAGWYPGDAWVDIVGTDHYPMDGNHRPAKDVFDELTKFARGKKLIAMGENGPIPDIAESVRERADWLFFTTWNGSILFDKTTPEELRADYNDPHVLNLGDLPDWKNYPVKTHGSPVKLGFSAVPENAAVNGTWRTPLTVNVLDEKGMTVREGSFSVKLALKKSSHTKISGELTAQTMNGVATFAGVKMDAPLKKCQLIATAKGLQDATSPVFEVGPGGGLLYEWWNQNNLTNAADGQKILGAALESPVAMATNFAARISGEIIAPQSGAYKFWIAGAGNFEFFLGADGSAGSKSKITFIDRGGYQKWPHANEVETPPVMLAGGKKYYFEIRQRQKEASTQLFVRWQLPDGTEERPIPAFRFELPKNNSIP